MRPERYYIGYHKSFETWVLNILALRKGKRISWRWKVRKGLRFLAIVSERLSIFMFCAAWVIGTGSIIAPYSTEHVVRVVLHYGDLCLYGVLIVWAGVAVWRSWMRSLRPPPRHVIRERYLRQMRYVRGFYSDDRK